jgi:hypothetical protein
MVQTVGFRDLPNGESGEEREEAVRYQIARGGRGGGEACLVTIRRASAAAMATNKSNTAPSERVGITEMSTGLKATPVGAVPTVIGLPTGLLLAVAMTETVFEV